MSHEFVDVFPIAEARQVAKAVISGQFTLALWRPAWTVAEYALVKSESEMSGARSIGPADDRVAMRTLEAAADAEECGEEPAARGIGISWIAIANVLLPRILNALVGRVPAAP